MYSHTSVSELSIRVYKNNNIIAYVYVMNKFLIIFTPIPKLQVNRCISQLDLMVILT